MCRVSCAVILPGGAVVVAELAMLLDGFVGEEADVAVMAELAAEIDGRGRRCDCRQRPELHSYRTRCVSKEQ